MSTHLPRPKPRLSLNEKVWAAKKRSRGLLAGHKLSVDHRELCFITTVDAFYRGALVPTEGLAWKGLPAYFHCVHGVLLSPVNAFNGCRLLHRMQGPGPSISCIHNPAIHTCYSLSSRCDAG